jgi:NhaP-type Na+/H+ or K+/H+ antiporter
MGEAELLIAGLLVAVAGLSALARQLSIPYPIVLVIGGVAVGFVPGLPEVKLDPQVVLVVFLPPLLYAAAFFANLTHIRASLRPITLNSVLLVLLTMTLVAVVAHRVGGRAPVGGGVRAGRGRLPDRSARRRGHHAPARHAAPSRQLHRGRGSLQ